MKFTKADIDNCKDEELKQALGRLYEYKDYCKLHPGNSETLLKTEQAIGSMPNQLKEWLTIFNGGLLFDIDMFSVKDEYSELSYPLTFEDINSQEFKTENDIDPSVVCFAMTNYGDYYCYLKDQSDECIYQWDAEECDVVIKWSSFSELLNEIIDFSITLIEEELLSPIKK